ncbi:sensor histidine kinase [Cellulomonas cellasea]|uniref:sensor histidine kinase n=1 Tax=Cellulomonas cellasea TaxID=43670 RepID=UPI0025A390AA|nr:sensor histidine kinase [Cellulomonas cellasea]MDM8084021.1 sensor histidine kinase [Cellulomonas cellasea]
MTAHRVAGRPAGSTPASAPWLLYDALLAVGVALTLSLLISAGVGDERPDAWAYLWAVGLGALMFVRRAYPTLVVALTVLGFVAYYAAGYTPIGVAAPVAAAVFSAAESARLAAAIGGSLVVVAVSATYRLAAGQDPAFVLGYDLPQNLLVLAAAVALGDSIRSRREVQRQSTQIASLTAEQYRREAEERLTAERLATSRDLHDSIGHSLAVISLHTEVAREATAPDDASRALEVIRTTTSGAMSDLRRTVAGLRRGEQPPRHTPGIAALDAAIEPARAAGISVTVDNDVQGPLPGAIETAVFRVVQESITNIVRHSAATEATVRIDADDGAVRVRVADNGPVTSTAPAGHGLLGMRERVEGLGGSLATRRTDPGFEVDATLPWEGP